MFVCMYVCMCVIVISGVVQGRVRAVRDARLRECAPAVRVHALAGLGVHQPHRYKAHRGERGSMGGWVGG